MFFTLSKLFWFFVEPVNLIFLVGTLGLLLGLGRFAGLGRRLVYGSMLALAICVFSPIGALLLRPLEDRFPVPSADMPAPTGIIVLGGSLDEDLSEARGQLTLMTAAERLTSGVALARFYPQARLVFTGGTAALSPHDAGESVGVRRLWLSLGVPEERMTFEGKSRNTWENAVFTRRLINPKPEERWLLVTSAWHMPRSVGIFRQAGFNVTPYPVDYRTYGDARDWRPARPLSDQLSMLDYAVHEWIGMVAYHMTGKTNALFPSP
jgi:uncharacterized SAM-binding protein YcdF (DUF218 family)